MRFNVAAILFIFLVASCHHSAPSLPILGNVTVVGQDTIYPSIADFSFIDQEGHIVTNSTFANQVYVADFIFLSCPTICPIMTKAMHRVYTSFAGDNRVAFISHTIDPIHDSIPRLKAYAESLGVAAAKWHFVTGEQDSIVHIAEHSYYATAYPDSTAPGGFTHSGGLLLVDQNRHIRGVYSSTDPMETQRLVADIKLLLSQ